MALQFDVDVLTAKDARQLLNCLSACGFTAARKSRGQRAFVTSRQADQAGGVLAQLVEGRCTITFRSFAHFELCNELTELLVSLARFTKQRDSCGFRSVLMREPCRRRQARTKIGHRDLRSNVGADIVALRAGVKAGRAVDAVVVEQRHRWHLYFYGAVDQALRL